jgi:PTS system N-acetylglucosamine-specific IIC component
MAGFFPVMMFGLPAACLAMYRTALPERRKAVGGLLLSMALTSFLTGVTEPIEFSFMFLAPVLYALHALLTGVSMALMTWLGIRLGFGFSAGMFDYLLNFPLATRPWLLLPIGGAYFALYYGLFRYFILKFDLQTLGRETDVTVALQPAVLASATEAHRWLDALGGPANVRSVEACTTRLRVTVIDDQRVQTDQIKQLGARGTIRPAAGTLQIVLGLRADQVASDIRAALRTSQAARKISEPVAAVSEAHRDDGQACAARSVADSILAGLGGVANIAEMRLLVSRVHLVVHDKARLEMAHIEQLGLRGFGITPGGALHLLIGPLAGDVHARLETLRRGR